MAGQAVSVAGLIVDHILARRTQGRLFCMAVCGAQGAGKSTATAEALSMLRAMELSAASLSLDDLYLSHAARQELARSVHPLFATRGVPGTHDVDLGVAIMMALREGRQVPLPRFDKAEDDPIPRTEWPLSPPNLDVILFEGWCVGAIPQARDALAAPVNALEAEEDPLGIWRTHANTTLGGPYRRLFQCLDGLCLLMPPDFDIVVQWRQQQEHELRARLAIQGARGRHVQSDQEIERFVRHYERITRHILDEMPARADITVSLDEQRGIASVHQRALP